MVLTIADIIPLSGSPLSDLFGQPRSLFELRELVLCVDDVGRGVRLQVLRPLARHTPARAILAKKGRKGEEVRDARPDVEEQLGYFCCWAGLFCITASRDEAK